MKAFVTAVVIAIVIAVAGVFALAAIQKPVYQAFATSSTRVGNPGHNLVGNAWKGTGLVRSQAG
jgi:Tfp pilus assembly protein PilV